MIIFRTIFCDLDGTLIHTKSGNTFPKDIMDMEFNQDLINAIKKVGCDRLLIVTNQGGIEKGYCSFKHMAAKLEYIRCALEEALNTVVDYEVAVSNDINNIFRKPNTGMLQDLTCRHFYDQFNTDEVCFIGDASGLPGQFSDSDRTCAENYDINYYDVNEFIKLVNER